MVMEMSPARLCENTPVKAARRLPVTLLSGFLGAGKTTLLEHILRAKHGLRIGVIVNDMAQLNIDAALLTNHNVAQKQEKVVQMQNGCICCTLRGDLLEEVANLALEGKVDYLLIESSGISEPLQVAETFSEEFAEMHRQAGEDLRAELAAESDVEKIKANAKIADILVSGGLSQVSRLDTCVTVVDAVNLLADFETADFLVDRHGKDVPEEDDRNVSDLMADQLEFANVIVLNKMDLVDAAHLERIKALVKTLNPEARLLTTVKSKVDVKDIINTGLFSYEKAALSAGWLKSLNEEVLPETEEYGIGSFVYRARRPFHPARLWHTIKTVFVVIQAEFIDDGEGSGDEDMDEDESGAMDTEEEQPQLNPAARLESKKASETFAPLLRSKGFIWLATRPLMFGEWSQAGVMLTLAGGSRWRCEVPEDEWPDDEQMRSAIRKDFEDPWGDRRQEIVLIGTDMPKGGEERLRAALDACLLDDDEFERFENIMRSCRRGCRTIEEKQQNLQETFEDGFEDWMDDEHDHEH